MLVFWTLTVLLVLVLATSVLETSLRIIQWTINRPSTTAHSYHHATQLKVINVMTLDKSSRNTNQLLLVPTLTKLPLLKISQKSHPQFVSNAAYKQTDRHKHQGCRGDWILMPIPIPYPQKNLWESLQNPHIHRIPKSSIPVPYTLWIFVWCIYHFIFCHVCHLYVVS